MPNFITNLKNAFNVDTAPIEILTGFQAIFATFGSYFVAGTYTAFGSLSILMILSGITQIISVG